MERKKTKFVKQIHKKARLNVERRTEQYAKQANKGCQQMIFEPRDWVWLNIRKEWFLAQRRSKLFLWGDGPFHVLECINDNAYKLDLPGEYSVSATFNVSDLFPFDVRDDFTTNPSQEKGNDEGTTNKWSMDPIQVPIGPVPKARSKRFKKTLHGLIQCIWAEESSCRSKGNSTHNPQGWVSIIQVEV